MKNTRSRNQRRAVPMVALASAAALLVAGCSSAGATDSDTGGAGKAAEKTTERGGPSLIAVDTATSGKITVKVDGGVLASVDVSARGPGKVEGTLSEDKSVWTSTTPLAPGTTYTISAQGTGGDGAPLSKSSSYTTPAATKTFVGTYNVDKGSTVGVALPVSITFNKPIHDKAAVERKLKVTSSPAVEGAWNWMKDRDGKDRIDYRPKEYWKPGTDVTLRMDLAGVDAGGGVYGTQQRVVNFRIGDAVTSTIDVVKKTMTVSKNGKALRTLKVSTGKETFETWNGTMVVLGKVPSIRMNSATVGIFGPEAYDMEDVKWDVQLTPSGTYAHAAPWNEGKFGRINASHGCIGMSTADAKWFYDQVRFGDPVTVVNSTDTVAVNNGYGAWNVDWETWKKGSALS
ncbi:Ig-like domain-containing protein [Streptomyces sp. P9(2023)]|uniref:L,D-transpeptidase n=1 Tax=Streptomyces sp. P9(2023) TaxID=3064394 RepID=UPI0028F402E0|nr:Ig-like domain-containing protein [Streptomyces sp. P9(2023)]MDT9691877.1 Ig-like domain-containing protein [Streptomyces sp. P9(2023)]